MKQKIGVQRFSDRKAIYQLVFRYLVDNRIVFEGNNINQLSKNVVVKYIKRVGVLYNEGVNNNHILQVNDGDIIEIPEYNVVFKCVLNERDDDIEGLISDIYDGVNLKNDAISKIDIIIKTNLHKYLNVQSLNEVPPEKTKIAFARIIKVIDEHGFESIKESNLSYELTNFLKSKLPITNIVKESSIDKKQFAFAGKLIELLIQVKIDKEKELITINNNLVDGLYSDSLFKYSQEQRKIIKSDIFQYLIAPLIDPRLLKHIIIENMIRFIRSAEKYNDISKKCNLFEANKEQFNDYIILVNSESYGLKLFKGIGEYLYIQFQNSCDTAIEKNAIIEIEGTKRRYNFHNLNRESQNLFFVIRNIGEGLAKNIVLESKSSCIIFNEYNVGILKPNEHRDIIVEAVINHDNGFESKIEIDYSWEETSGKVEKSRVIIEFLLQNSDVPWEDLKRKNPYSNSIIDSPDKLFGREEIIKELKDNILSDNIESYKLWGQKRVGKSSIVKTLKSLLEKEQYAIVVYRSIGGLKNENPIITLNTLGESLCSEIYEEIDKKIDNPSLREGLKNVVIPSFNGSLFPLESYIKSLKKIHDPFRFVFILDEFDRINEEFFLHGNLGETLSLSIGKGLNEYRYIGFILVGSENMHLLDRQGINYNSYHEKEVDTFNKHNEYDAFSQIIKKPLMPFINYSEEAIERVFFNSNGNPYFANLICSIVFKTIYKNKDSEVDINLVEESIQTIVNASQKSHFEHYWGDGLTDESNIKKERKTDVRKRILLTFSLLSDREKVEYPTQSNLIKHFRKPSESEYTIEKYEIDNTIKEFINRKIFITNDSLEIRILPPLFEGWLMGSGKSMIIEGISDLEALQQQIDFEESVKLNIEELRRLSDNYHFMGESLSVEKYQQFLNQFGGAIEQRRVFKLLDSIYYISKDELIDFYRKERRNIFRRIEIYIKEKSRGMYREGVEVYTFSNNLQENSIPIESFKKLNNIRKQLRIRCLKDDCGQWKLNKCDEIIIIEPIILNINDIRDELFLLLNEESKNSDVSIRLISFVITIKAKTDLIKLTNSYRNFKLVSFKEVAETRLKPFIIGTEIFENSEESNQAFYEIRKHFPNTKEDTILVLFEDYCPAATCPILWHSNSQFTSLFPNEYGINQYDDNKSEEEDRRTRVYHANTELSQKINSFIVRYLKNLARKGNKEDWFISANIPKSVMETVSSKWISESTIHPKESYFDFWDYKKIIEKHPVLMKIFNIPGEGNSWCEKLNVLRRDPAHPEKPAPSIEGVLYFEKMTKIIIKRLNEYPDEEY